MSLTTVAATVIPDELLAKLPPSRPERFQRGDFIAAAVVFLTTLGVYVATLAPNVTLQDSGELITAATKFGVGHPPGYPLWTMFGFVLSHIFPFGNLAWRINLLCALFGAASNAVLTLLVCHSGRWLLQRWTDTPLQPIVRQFSFYSGMLSGLTIGFSEVMWSQAVISAVHGTLNALFINLVLLFFYLWLLEPKKAHRLIITVFIFALGLTNHHTLVQIIPAFLLAALLIQVIPSFLGKPALAPAGTFFSFLTAVNLFSLSILVYISWLSGDGQLQAISEKMALIVLGLTAAGSFFYLKEFHLHLFLLGVATAAVIFAYGHYLLTPSETSSTRYLIGEKHFWLVGSLVTPGWLQITTTWGWAMLALAALAVGLLYTSSLSRRMVIGAFIAGWIGLMPYSYEPIASSTHPPMNWGFPSERSGFYYAVSREQYPKSLPNLIKMTFGKAIGVVPKDAQLDATIGLPAYLPRLGMSFYFYGDNIQRNFTVPLIFLALALLVYIRRCDWPQVNWLIFLAVAWFFVGFMLQLIAPQEAFDFQHNIQYKVFHLQSHCIFAIMMGYGALAAMTYLYESMPDVGARLGMAGFGCPAIFLALLPLWNNFDSCSQAEHWFGYMYGSDIMRPLNKNAVFFGGSDAGRFVPTYMAFVESQQDDRWKREPGFDRRDVAVITQNALCDTYYTKYIRNQYDPRFRPKPDQWTPFEKWLGRDQAYPKTNTACMSDEELQACWDEYRARPDVMARENAGGPALRPGSNDVFEINGIVALKIFQKNKNEHTFYLEQSIPIEWMYPYLVPSGLILRLNPEPLKSLPPEVVEEDYKYWDDYSQRLLSNPRFHLDDDAMINFGKLALWHADVYRWRNMDKEEEHWLRISFALCPQQSDTVNNLCRLLAREQRYDEAITVAQEAVAADPYNDQIAEILTWLDAAKTFGAREIHLRDELAESPYDVGLNLDLARLLEDEGKFPEVNDRLRIAAGLTNWTHDAMAEVIQYYVDKVHNPDAAAAFLETRAKITPDESELVYSLAALHASMNHNDDALKYLTQSAQGGHTNALISAKIDPRFQGLHDDPRFQALIDSGLAPVALPLTNGPTALTNAPASQTNSATTNAPTTNAPTAKAKSSILAKPVKK